MPLFPRLPLPHEFPIPAWLHKAGFKTGRTKFHSWEGKKLRRRLKTVRGGRISRFLRMYIYIARTFAQIEGPSLKLGGTERERERVRDRFSNGVKLPSVLTWMIIGRENFIESIILSSILFFCSFSSYHFPRRHEAIVKARLNNWLKLIERKNRRHGYKFSSSRPSPAAFFPARIAIVALSRNIPGNPNLCFFRI